LAQRNARKHGVKQKITKLIEYDDENTAGAEKAENTSEEVLYRSYEAMSNQQVILGDNVQLVQ